MQVKVYYKLLEVWDGQGEEQEQNMQEGEIEYQGVGQGEDQEQDMQEEEDEQLVKELEQGLKELEPICGTDWNIRLDGLINELHILT